MALTEPFADFLNTADFGTAATYNSTTVNVVFSREYIEANGIEGYHPMIQGKESDFSGAVQGSTIVISSVTYVMKELQPDGYGWITILLHKQ